EAAEALDVLNQRHGLQHLDIKPQNLFLIANHVKVGDFGLVQHTAGGGKGLGAITPLYASPEVFQGSMSQASDQYSLAIVYMEMLTGQTPFTGKNARQLMIQHVQAEPELSPLPEADRAAVARALDKSPASRFASCMDFVHALESGQSEVLVALPDIDTRKSPAARTVRTRAVPTVRPLVAEGVEIVELVSRTPLTEVWKARAADGSARVVSVVFGCAGQDVLRLGQLRHPGLLPTEILSCTPGRLVLCQRVAERTLRDALAESQGRGMAGIPRRQLLAYLRTASETLAHFEREGVWHLGLNPRSLVLDGGRLLVKDVGLAQMVWSPARQNLAQLNSRYAAPELRLREPGPACDQYSLALIYHEMLTGAYPAPGKARPGETAVPDVTRLPESDRMLVARALHPDPRKRWECPVELFRALEASGAPEPDPVPGSVRAAAPTHQGWLRPATLTHQGSAPSAKGGASMQMRFATNLGAAAIAQRLEGFRQQWQAEAVAAEPRRIAYTMPTPRSLWQRWAGKQPTLDIALELGGAEMDAPAGVQTRTELSIVLATKDGTHDQAEELLRAVGPLLVDSVRKHLQQATNGRRQERLPWLFPFRLCAVGPDGKRGPMTECQGKDISLNGIGFYIQGALPGASLLLDLPQTPQTPGMAVPARVVRMQGHGDGWLEVGAVLLPPDELPEE
ncbi:MAG: protein kinase, partial [Gemmataceae bacterium]|nr:protein kinase [Gemmataceae bacterium]